MNLDESGWGRSESRLRDPLSDKTNLHPDSSRFIQIEPLLGTLETGKNSKKSGLNNLASRKMPIKKFGKQKSPFRKPEKNP